jgi:hypothetical protein
MGPKGSGQPVRQSMPPDTAPAPPRRLRLDAKRRPQFAARRGWAGQPACPVPSTPDERLHVRLAATRLKDAGKGSAISFPRGDGSRLRPSQRSTSSARKGHSESPDVI